MDIIKQIRKATISDLVSRGKRFDERDFDSYRDISIKKSVLTSTEGSALVHLGNTQVLAAVKLDLGTPYPDRPDEGMLSTSAELVPFASPMFEPGPPGENAIELARVVDRGIRAGEIIDLKSFFIEEGKVFGLFIDLYVLDSDGNMLDAGTLAAMAALTDAKMPRYEDGELIREDMKPLKLGGTVVASTFAKVNGSLLLDPCGDEERGMDGRITMATLDAEKIVAIQKSGEAGFTVNDIDHVLDISLKKSRELIETIKKAPSVGNNTLGN